MSIYPYEYAVWSVNNVPRNAKIHIDLQFFNIGNTEVGCHPDHPKVLHLAYIKEEKKSI